MKRLLRIFSVLAVLVSISVLALGLYLSNGKTLEAAHVPAAFTEPFDYAAGSVEDYLAWSERRVRASRIDFPSSEDFSHLLPFVLEPDENCPVNQDGKYPDGIVLVHGLIASTWSMRPLAEHFQSRCFSVIAVLLPGHGTRPGDMLSAHWEQWQQDVNFATRQMAEKTGRVFLSGHSVGGTLAVLEAVRNELVDTLILFAPAMQVTQASKYAALVSKIGAIFPAAAWFEVEPEDAVFRYESFPFSAAAETWSLIKTTQQALKQSPLSIPVLTVASAQDTTVLVQATFDFMAAQSHPSSFTLLYTQHDLPPYENTRIVNSNIPGQGILGLSHLGLMTPPSHPFYGSNAAYRYCGHYFDQPGSLYQQCKAGERAFYGETTDENLRTGLIERIAFNPFYEEMLGEIDLFIEQVKMDPRGLPIQRSMDGGSLLNREN